VSNCVGSYCSNIKETGFSFISKLLKLELLADVISLITKVVKIKKRQNDFLKFKSA